MKWCFKVYYSGCPKHPDGRVLRRHGDILRLHPGGFYESQGRADDTMNLGGIKTSCADLERVVNGHLNVVESAAIAVQAPGGSADMLVVYVVLKTANEAPMCCGFISFLASMVRISVAPSLFPPFADGFEK